MNPLPFLVFILCLGSLNCFHSLVETTPAIREHCLKEADVGERNLMDLYDRNVKCYYYCVYEQEKIIVNGKYRGNILWCRSLEDTDYCELAADVINCVTLRHGR